MNDTQITKLLSETYTKDQLLKRLRVIKDFISFRLFNLTPEQNKLPLPAQVELFLALHQKDIIELNILRLEGNWAVSLKEEFYNQFTLDNYQGLFKALDQISAQVNPIIVYLPIELPEKDRFSLGSWFKQNLGLTTLFELQFDANLIGGCALSFKGTYKDYSLRSKISQNQAQIISSLKEFKR